MLFHKFLFNVVFFYTLSHSSQFWKGNVLFLLEFATSWDPHAEMDSQCVTVIWEWNEDSSQLLASYFNPLRSSCAQFLSKRSVVGGPCFQISQRLEISWETQVKFQLLCFPAWFLDLKCFWGPGIVSFRTGKSKCPKWSRNEVGMKL